MGFKFRILIILFLVTGPACTSSRWIVEDMSEVDRSKQKLLDSELFLEQVGDISPASPSLKFQLKASNTYQYMEKVRADRYVQRYKPKIGFSVLSLAGAGFATYLANSGNKIAKPSTAQKRTFLGAGVFLAGITLMNMETVGAPQPTGEKKLLRNSGRTTEPDTVAVNFPKDAIASYNVFYKGEITARKKIRELTGSLFSINLVQDIRPEDFPYDPDLAVDLEVNYDGRIYSRTIYLRDIFERVIVVNSSVTALRSEPFPDSRNLVTELAFGSQLKLLSEKGEWYKVSYGISEMWVSKRDASPAWRTSGNGSDISVIAVPELSFGEIDVEAGIPKLAANGKSSASLIIANKNFTGKYPERRFAERDAMLMKAYFEKALDIPEKQIVEALNIENQEQVVAAYNRLVTTADFTNSVDRLIVYVSGYVTKGKKDRIEMLGINKEGEKPEEINLNDLFDGLSDLPVKEIIVIADLDNIEDEKSTKMFLKFSDEIAKKIPHSAIVFSSHPSQRSNDYYDRNRDQKRHSIFTYYFADALKRENTSLRDITRYLERNVDYTSRRIHNKPQEIIYYGDLSIDLAN